jgi:hypothetical protein
MECDEMVFAPSRLDAGFLTFHLYEMKTNAFITALAMGTVLSSVTAAIPAESGGAVQVYLTAKDTGQKLAPGSRIWILRRCRSQRSTSNVRLWTGQPSFKPCSASAGVDDGGRDIRLPLSASALFVNKTCDYAGPVHVHAPIMFTS